MRCFLIAFFFAALTSCMEDQKKIDQSIFIHDRSSKVWLVDKKMQGEKDYTPLRFEYKELVVFHQSGNAYFYKMQEFGKYPGYKMTFELNRETDEFILTNSKMTRTFKIKSLGRRKMIIESTDKKYPYTLHLIPFPEY
jgi:hypothetical protein